MNLMEVPARVTRSRIALPAARLPGSRWLVGSRRVLDVVDLVELDVERAHAGTWAGVLDAPDVDRLHDVARLRVDRDRPARALPVHALGRCNEAFPVGLAGGLPQSLIDQVHAVPAADRVDVGVA